MNKSTNVKLRTEVFTGTFVQKLFLFLQAGYLQLSVNAEPNLFWSAPGLLQFPCQIRLRLLPVLYKTKIVIFTSLKNLIFWTVKKFICAQLQLCVDKRLKGQCHENFF